MHEICKDCGILVQIQGIHMIHDYEGLYKSVVISLDRASCLTQIKYLHILGNKQAYYLLISDSVPALPTHHQYLHSEPPPGSPHVTTEPLTIYPPRPTNAGKLVSEIAKIYTGSRSMMDLMAVFITRGGAQGHVMVGKCNVG